ncbi:MAG: type II toxin-antitoxin system VapC family toxin [Pyrinomonadaceae bacterium]
MLLDTSGLFCLHHADDLRHHDAVIRYRARPRWLTSSYVLSEFVALANARRLSREGALVFMRDLLDNPAIEVVWVDEVIHRQTLDLLQARLDKTYSLCDAVSFVIMRERGITDALTTDHHFEQEGFVRLLKP